MTRGSGNADFWARRRAAVAAEAEAEEREAQELRERAERAAQEEKTDEQLLEELDLPDPDTLVSGDDFAAFMKRAVPERLRRRALRRLWVSDPVLANLDNLVDYNDDYTAAAHVNDVVQTSYKVGQGMQFYLDRKREEAERAAGAALTEDGSENGPENGRENTLDDAPVDASAALSPDAESDLGATADTDAGTDPASAARDDRGDDDRGDGDRASDRDSGTGATHDEEDTSAAPRLASGTQRRRMRFAFDGEEH
ncbi:DUF3306 domain-containing protein [Brevirhabdus sp.]|uniref:DUF3306 domain-containing protein n=1 Tax=Brevirhabdus sp. TaxID=2004514 RepID=UPI004059C52C